MNNNPINIDDIIEFEITYKPTNATLNKPLYEIDNDIVEIESYSYKYEANKLMTLSVKQDNNTYTVYLDNNEIFKVTANAFNLSGHVGVFSKNAEAVIKEIKVQ